jgi:predicted DNA-binding transcriptional regulator YafY
LFSFISTSPFLDLYVNLLYRKSDICHLLSYFYDKMNFNRSTLAEVKNDYGGRIMRADRLLQIMLLLQTRGCLTSKELAARLEVSERTIFRDMEALSAAGVPVYAERGVQGGWKLAEGYRTDWAGLNKEEIVSLLAAKPHRHLSDLGWSPKFEAALLKLLASLSPTLRRDVEYARERLYVDGAGWHPSGEDVPLLPLLQEAVWAGRQLRLDYASGSGSGGMRMDHASGSGSGGLRIVHPLGLVLKGSLWYLVAIPDETQAGGNEDGKAADEMQTAADVLLTKGPAEESAELRTNSSVREEASQAQKTGSREGANEAIAGGGARSESGTPQSRAPLCSEPRSYRASRIRAAELLAAPALRPDGFDLAAYWERSVRRFRAELPRYPARALVHENARARLERTRFVRIAAWAGPTVDGPWREASLEFDTLKSACEIALSFGAQLRILEPAELRDAVIAAAHGVLELYGAGGCSADCDGHL